MLVNSVIIVLREVLEAAFMVSVLLLVSRRIGIGQRWLIPAVLLGVLGATIYAHYLGAVSELFDGVGQELLNAAMHVIVFVALIVTVFIIARRHVDPGSRGRLLTIAMVATVSPAVMQEGSEIIVYVSGFLQVEEFMLSVSMGSLAGAGIGFSIGVLLYYVLLATPARRAYWASISLLGFAAASMCIQVAGLLIQADWLPAARPIWNSSALIGEDSLPGQLLYALIGYEATPSAIEAGVYVAGLATILLAAMLGGLFAARAEPEVQ